MSMVSGSLFVLRHRYRISGLCRTERHTKAGGQTDRRTDGRSAVCNAASRVA